MSAMGDVEPVASGGYPERCGICIAAEDTVSEGIDSRFRIG